MKIGVVHFGCSTAGTAQIVRTLIDSLSGQENSVYGIELSRTTKEVELRELTKSVTTFTLGESSYTLKSFPIEIWKESSSELAKKLSVLDKLVLLGGHELNDVHFSPKQLHVPVSIFNDVEGSQFTLGYDTALNSIVENIEYVRDTASSLSYGKVRVFNVQVPGNTPSTLLKHSALAVGAEIILYGHDQEVEQLKQHIRNKEANNEGYTFILMNQSVDPVSLADHFKEFDLDWKVVEIEEAQCGGPYPTALDRILATQLQTAVKEWSLSDEASGQLLVQDQQVILKRYLLSEG